MTVYCITSRIGRIQKMIRILSNGMILLSLVLFPAVKSPASANSSVLDPIFTVFPEWEWIDAMYWPDGALLTATVAGKPECVAESTSYDGFTNMGFPEDCDVVVGDLVIVTDGDTTRMHTVLSLAITSVSADDDTVQGTADEGEIVHVWLISSGEIITTTVDSGGAWQVDFSGLYDLLPGDVGRAQIYDEADNSTSVEWQIPNPRIVVQIDDDWIRAEEFAPCTELTFEIYDFEGGSLQVDPPETSMSDETGTAWLHPSLDLQPPNYFVITDGFTIKALELEAFTFNLLDLTTGLAEGSAPPPYERDVWIGIGFPDDGWDRLVQTDESGNWAADFEQPIPHNFDWVAAQIFDNDGDASEIRPAELYGDWVGVFIHTMVSWAWPEGEHSYYFEDNEGNQEDPVDFTVSWDAPVYEGHVLLRGNVLWAFDGEACILVDNIHPSQPTRFHSGWTTPEPMTYVQAVDHFLEFTPWIMINGEHQVDFTLYEIRLFSLETWWDYVCGSTMPGSMVPHIRLTAFPDYDYVEGWDWPQDETVSLYINDNFIQEQVVDETYYVGFSFEYVYDLQAGDWVVLSTGAITQTYQVEELALVAIDIVEDTVSGQASSGMQVFTWPDATGEQLMSIAGEDGQWQVDFTGFYDLGQGDCGRSEIRNMFGNATAIDWCTVNPEIRVWLGSQKIDGYYWPAGEVNLEIFDPVSQDTYTDTGIAAGDPDSVTVQFMLTDFLLEPGQVVTISGSGFSKTHTIPPLEITAIDIQSDIVSGTSSPGARVSLYIYAGDGYYREVEAGSDGLWSFDYSGIFDFKAGDGMDTTEFDDDGDGTSFEYHLPYTSFLPGVFFTH
jgi:hypothetical protein